MGRISALFVRNIISVRAAGSANASLKKGLLASVIILVMLSVAFEPQAYAATQPVAGTPIQLSVNVIPLRLPADGGTYRAVVVSLEDGAGHPSVALTNITVYLSSSSENVAMVENPIVIYQGDLYATANLTTTVTPGTATITASSAGLQTASQQVRTETPSGFPYSLKVYLAPETVISGSGYRGLIIVELLDQLGLPARAGNDTVVQLSSSDTSVANVTQKSLVIHLGDILTSGNYTTAYIPGRATVTAVASGLHTGADTVTVTGSSPLFLKVFAQPATIGLESTGRLSLGLTDSSGDPTRAPAALEVQITSSNLTVATAPPQVTIPAGSSFALTNYTTTAVPGTASLTFSASGLNSGNPIQVRSVGGVYAPEKLEVLVGPTSVLADGEGYSAVAVSLVDLHGNPAVAPECRGCTGIAVGLTSSDTQVGSIPPSVTIQPGSDFAAVPFTTTYLAGTTTITAFANGLQTNQQSISTFGPVPAQLKLQVVPGTLPANGNSYGALEVLLEDSSGAPAVAASGIVVQLLSSESSIVSVDSSVTIPAGSVFVVANLQTTLLPGLANITAFATGLTPSLIGVQTRIPAPSSVAAYITPANSLLSGVGPQPILVVQLQDSGGNPAEAGANTLVLVTASNSTLLRSPFALTIPKGEDYVATGLDVLSSGSVTITTVSPGLVASAVSMGVVRLAPTVSLAPPYKTIFAESTLTVQVTVTMEGAPVPGVHVSWNSSTGSVSPNFTVTNGEGVASTVFLPPPGNLPGYANVRASLSSPDFGTAGALSSITYTMTPVKHPPTLADTIFSYLIYAIPVLAAVIAVEAYLTIRRRRRRAREELEAGFQTLS